jgi:hypothetical protein
MEETTPPVTKMYFVSVTGSTKLCSLLPPQHHLSIIRSQSSE